MGIVREQSIASSIYIYLGFAIGAFNVLFLFPKYLTPAEFGLTRVLLDVSLLIAMFCTLGSCPAVLKFYPFYHSYLPKKKIEIPFFTILLTILGCIIFILIADGSKSYIVRKFGEKSPLFNEYYYLIYPLSISYAFWYLFEASSWSIKKTVLPNFLKEVGFRIITTILVALYIVKLISFKQFISLFSLMYIVPVIILLYALLKDNFFVITFNISSVTKRLWKQITLFSLFVFTGQTLNVIARTSDTIILASQSKNGLADAAVFTVVTYLVTLMDVPMRGMTGIASSVIAYAWKDKDMNKIKEMYQKTALNLLIVGIGIFGILTINMFNFTQHFGTNYSLLPTLLLILGFAKLIDLATGMNAQILLSSKYWRIDFITSMGFVLISVPLNIFLIKKYGLIGSAYANLISVFIYNTTRLLIIWKLFKLQPYNHKNLLTMVIAAVCFFIVYISPSLNNIYADAILKTVVFMPLYIFLILKLKISEDFNQLLLSFIEKIKIRTKK